MTFEKWERFAEPIMTVLSLIFLVIYVALVLGEPYGLVSTTLHVLMYAMWVIFALDYIVRMVLVPSSKWRWFIGHLFDLFVTILPMFRPLRLVTRISQMKVMKETTGSQGFRTRIVTYTVATSVMVLFVGSLALFDAERNAPLSQIDTYGEALWCVWVSTTSVGYGDITPVSVQGRIIAAILMFAGIILNGIICALLSSWLIQEESIRKNREDRLTKERVAKINGRMDEMAKEFARMHKTIDQIAEQMMPEEEDEENEEDESDEGDENDEEDSDAADRGEAVSLEEQAVEQAVRDSIREAQYDNDVHEINDQPDPDSGYVQMASPAVYTRRSQPMVRDPKVNRLTGEKPPSTFRKNPDPTVTGRIPPVHKD